MDVGEYAELHDFLGEILHPEISPDLNSSMTAIATSSESQYPLQYQQQQLEGSVPVSPLAASMVCAPKLPLHNSHKPIPEASNRVSPAPSIASGGDSSGDDSSTAAEDGIPHTVTTGPFQYDDTFQEAHQQHKNTATSSEDVVAKKKIRRR